MGEARNVLEEQSPFIYPPCSLMFAYFQYWKAKKRTTDKERRKGVLKSVDSNELLRSLRVSTTVSFNTECEILSITAIKEKVIQKSWN